MADFNNNEMTNEMFLEAVMENNREEIVRLLNAGADINRAWDGAFNCIGMSLDNPDLLQFLIDEGANPAFILQSDIGEERKTVWGDLGYIFLEDVQGNLETVSADTWIQTLTVLQNAGVEIRKPFQTFGQGERTLASMLMEAINNTTDNNIRGTLQQVYDWIVM